MFIQTSPDYVPVHYLTKSFPSNIMQFLKNITFINYHVKSTISRIQGIISPCYGFFTLVPYKQQLYNKKTSKVTSLTYFQMLFLIIYKILNNTPYLLLLFQRSVFSPPPTTTK